MKKLLLFLVTFLLPIAANADPVEIDGIFYNLIIKGKVAEVTTNPNGYKGDVVIPETIIYEDTEYRVTTISDVAFHGCIELSSLIIPENAISIGNSAFYGCKSLTSIYIPKGITSIGEDAFAACTGLTSVHISDLEAWCNISFKSYESNPLRYAHHLFLNNEEIKDLIIPQNVITIRKFVFSYIDGLASVIINDNVTSIEIGAFSGCSNLTAITIPDRVVSIGTWAFSDCSGLTSVVIGNSVKNIEFGAFERCSSLTSISFGNSVTSIGEHAFASCSSLTTLNIPNCVLSIGVQAFMDCSGLTSVVIGNGVTTIKGSAFSGCNSMSSLTIGKGVKTIEHNSFSNCLELIDVFCFAESVPNTAANAFEGSYIEYATLHVPGSSVDAYKSTEPWSSFGTIKAIEHESPGNENGDGYWSTYYNSMGNFEADDNTKVYTASLDELQEKLVLTEVTDKIIKAGQGVILKSTSANANLAYTSAEGTEGFYTNNALKGFDEATTTTAVEGTIYVLGENSSKELGFYKYSGTTLNANKAYLEINASSARQFYSIDDNTTDISRIMNAPKTTEQIFNLQGQQVAHPSKGAYIVNGHKVIIK